ncbi:MAG: hypothetical protein AB7T06_04170 [Kofleriaceae bacterium]
MSRYDLFRKRIAPIAFILGMGLLVRETCQKEQRIHATIVIRAGEAEAKVKSIDAKVVVEGETLGELHREAAPGMRIGDARFEVALPEEDAQLIIDVDMEGGARHVLRRIHATEGATIDLDLSSDLR